MKVLQGASKVKVILFIIMITFGICRPSYSQLQSTQKDSTLQRYAYLKFSVFPFFYSQFRKYPDLWLIFHYEFQTRKQAKFSYNAVIDYHNWDYKQILNGVPVSVIPDNIELFIRPQVRLYAGKRAFEGFFIGLFPLYLYRDLKSSKLKGSYWGAGAIGGYQFFIQKKIPIEINFWISSQTGVVDKVDPWGNPNPGRDTNLRGLFEVNIGWPFKQNR